MSILEAIVIAIVEGLTEFLPISSTGHMIIAERLLGVEGDFVKLFTVAIQLGAILAVIILYWRRFRLWPLAVLCEAAGRRAPGPAARVSF